MLVCQFRHSPGRRVPSPPAYYQTPSKASSAATDGPPQFLRHPDKRRGTLLPTVPGGRSQPGRFGTLARRRPIVEHIANAGGDLLRAGGDEPAERTVAQNLTR